MADRHTLSDEEWERLLPILQNTPGIHIVFPARCRQFVEAVLWILRTGSQWRQLSAPGLKWNSVFKRFSRWSQHGVWQALLEALAQEADLQNICIDNLSSGTPISWSRQKTPSDRFTRSNIKESPGKAGGLPYLFILSGGQCADIAYAQPLVENIPTPMVLADKGYDADAFLVWLANNGKRLAKSSPQFPLDRGR